jgi:hypothetical protein
LNTVMENTVFRQKYYPIANQQVTVKFILVVCNILKQESVTIWVTVAQQRQL